MASPVGPASADPNDPDLWDWGSDDDMVRRPHPFRAALAVLVVISLIVLLAASVS